MVGFSCIIYWSVIGIYSAIDVAQKDLITEASANFSTDKDSKIDRNNLDIDNRFNLNDFVEKFDDKLESNISIPPIKEMIGKNTLNNSYLNRKESFNIFEQERKIVVKSNLNKIKTLDHDDEIKLSAIEENSIETKNVKIENKEDPISSFLPPKLGEKAENYRFLASLDNELEVMEYVLKSLSIKITHPKLINVSKLLAVLVQESKNDRNFIKNACILA